MVTRGTGPADVVVVGAGLAGLAAARALHRQGRRVVVLEAAGEVGGRARTRTLGGHAADLGGEWVGPRHRHVQRLARELGLPLTPARTLGRPVRWRLPSGTTTGRLPPRGTRHELVRLLHRAARDSRGLDPRTPWAGGRAADLDQRSLADWLEDPGIGEDTRSLVEILVGSLSSSTPDRMSLLHFLWWTRLGGGPLRSLATTFAARVEGGAQALATGMARELGDTVHTDAEVISVAQDRDHVVATTASGAVHRAARAVVAVPLPRLPALGFDPALPDGDALGALRVGPGRKVVALLPPGTPRGHDTVVGGHSLWVAWRVGRRVTGFAPPQASPATDEERTAELAADFDCPPDRLERVTTLDWADEPYVRGCDVAFAPGEVCRLGPALREPHGLVRFAGAERSSWPNNMEGALESGHREAERLVR